MYKIQIQILNERNISYISSLTKDSDTGQSVNMHLKIDNGEAEKI